MKLIFAAMSLVLALGLANSQEGTRGLDSSQRAELQGQFVSPLAEANEPELNELALCDRFWTCFGQAYATRAACVAECGAGNCSYEVACGGVGCPCP